MPINQGNFDSVYDVLHRNNVFVIPIFQRPYAWEDVQIQQLFDDIVTGANRKNSFHYLAPIHVVEVESSVTAEWNEYVDQSNDDIRALAALGETSFRGDDGAPIRVFLVVDGQQRLTTLFYLFWILNPSGLTCKCGDREIPRIILNPKDDHYAFRKMLGLSPSSSPAIQSKAQVRLQHCYSKSADFSKAMMDKARMFVVGRGFKILQVELEPPTGLQAFQTQNDRGKSLTVLEKLKSLIMEFDQDADCGLFHQTHTKFGETYRALDMPDCLCTEEEFVQLLAITIRIFETTDCLYQNAERAYTDYFSHKIRSAGNIVQLLSGWIKTIGSASEQLEKLRQWKAGNQMLPSYIMPSVPNRTLADDYIIVLDSLGLNIRFLAMLCVFGSHYPGVQWHDKIACVSPDNRGVVTVLRNRFNTVRGQATGSLPAILSDKVAALEKRIDALMTGEEQWISALEVAERLQLFTLSMGANRPGGFMGYWKGIFQTEHSAPEEALQKWYEFATVYYDDNRARFIDAIFTPYLNENIKKYLLREYEFSKYGENIHGNTSLQIEHIFPENPTTKPPVGYFPSTMLSTDYDRFVDLLGNQMFLDARLNGSIRNALPTVKGQAYASQRHNAVQVHPVQNRVRSAIAVGEDFCQFKEPWHYRIYLDLRALELAAFAAERFF